MKRIINFLVILALTLATFTIAKADVPGPGGPYNSAFRVQNLDTAASATCSYIFYDASGVAAYTSGNSTVASGDSLYVYVPDLTTLGSGSYSAVVTCDKTVASVSNFSTTASGSSFAGISSPNTTWYAPGIYNNYYGYYSNIIVQNATSAAVDVTVNFYAPGNSTAVKTITKSAVPANASTSFEQEGVTELSKNVAYSAVINATGNVAPIVNIYGKGTTGTAPDAQLYTYNPFTAGATTVYAPLIMNSYYGFNTALVIQNLSSSATANVTVAYSNGFSSSYTIAANSPKSIYTPSEGSGTGLPAGNTLYAATVTSDQPIVAIVNESSASNNRASSYTGFTSGSKSVSLPIMEKFYYNYDSSVVCQNVDSSAATMKITYAGISSPTTSGSIDKGKVASFYQWLDPALANVANNWIGSATVTSASNIVCVVNQDLRENGNAAKFLDQLYTYNGFTGQ